MFNTEGGRIVHQVLQECTQKGQTELTIQGEKTKTEQTETMIQGFSMNRE